MRIFLAAILGSIGATLAARYRHRRKPPSPLQLDVCPVCDRPWGDR